MRIIKPRNSTLISRPYRFQQKNYLAVTGIIMVDNNNGFTLCSEQELWKFFTEICNNEFQTNILDMGVPRKQPEILVFGYGFGKYSENNVTAVSFKLNNVNKSLLVFGDRYWDGNNISSPVRFDKIPVNWANSFGGKDYPYNPFGKGINEINIGNKKYTPLPNIEKPGNLIYSKSDSVIPQIFTPIFIEYPERNMLLGTYGQEWREKDFPGFANDIDWSYFNQAFPDQRLISLSAGDEITYTNMNEESRILKTLVPDIKIKVFLKPKQFAFMDPLPLKLTSYWGFPHCNKSFLIFQNSIQVESDDDSDMSALIMAIDYKDDYRPNSHYIKIYEDRISFKSSPSSYINDRGLVTEEILPKDIVFPISDQLIKPMKRAFKEIDENKARIQKSEKHLNKKLNQFTAKEKLSPEEMLEEKTSFIPESFRKIPDEEYLSESRKILEKGHLTIEDIDKSSKKDADNNKSLLDFKREEKKLKKSIQVKIKDVEDSFKDVKDSDKLGNLKKKFSERSKVDLKGDILYLNTEANNLTQYIKDYYEKANKQFKDLSTKPPLMFENEIDETACLESNFDNIINSNGSLTYKVSNSEVSKLDSKGFVSQRIIFERVNFHNIVFDQVTFNNVKFMNCKFTNVTFLNCSFEKTQFLNCVIETMAFKFSSFLTVNSFINNIFTNTIFDNIVSGRIIFRNNNFSSSKFINSGFNRCLFDYINFNNCSFLRLGLMFGRFNNISFVDCQDIDSLAIAIKIINNLEFVNCYAKTSTLTMNSKINNLRIIKSEFVNSGFRENIFKNVEITNSNLSKNDFSYSNFNNLKVSNTHFVESLFDKSCFDESSLVNCDFRLANLKSSSFISCVIRHSSFYSSELSMVLMDENTVISDCETNLANFVPKRGS